MRGMVSPLVSVCVGSALAPDSDARPARRTCKGRGGRTFGHMEGLGARTPGIRAIQ